MCAENVHCAQIYLRCTVIWPQSSGRRPIERPESVRRLPIFMPIVSFSFSTVVPVCPRPFSPSQNVCHTECVARLTMFFVSYLLRKCLRGGQRPRSYIRTTKVPLEPKSPTNYARLGKLPGLLLTPTSRLLPLPPTMPGTQRIVVCTPRRAPAYSPDQLVVVLHTRRPRLRECGECFRRVGTELLNVATSDGLHSPARLPTYERPSTRHRAVGRLVSCLILRSTRDWAS